MKTEEEFDSFLKSQLDDTTPDHHFTDAVMGRIARHRRQRRITMGIAIAVAAAGAWLAAPSQTLAAPGAGIDVIVPALLLMTLCCLIWIETETARPRSSHGRTP